MGHIREPYAHFLARRVPSGWLYLDISPEIMLSSLLRETGVIPTGRAHRDSDPIRRLTIRHLHWVMTSCRTRMLR